jgi:hypothetical protein
VAAARAVFRAALRPGSPWDQPHEVRRAIAALSSVEPSSTTMTS